MSDNSLWLEIMFDHVLEHENGHWNGVSLYEFLEKVPMYHKEIASVLRIRIFELVEALEEKPEVANFLFPYFDKYDIVHCMGDKILNPYFVNGPWAAECVRNAIFQNVTTDSQLARISEMNITAKEAIIFLRRLDLRTAPNFLRELKEKKLHSSLRDELVGIVSKCVSERTFERAMLYASLIDGEFNIPEDCMIEALSYVRTITGPVQPKLRKWLYSLHPITRSLPF